MKEVLNHMTDILALIVVSSFNNNRIMLESTELINIDQMNEGLKYARI